MSKSEDDVRPPLTMEEVMPDTPEIQIDKLEDNFPILRSRVLFLNSKLNDNPKNFNNELLIQHKEEYEAALKYLTLCSRYHLQSYMLKQMIAGHQLLNVINENGPSTAVEKNTRSRILERLDVSMQLSLELRALQSELAEAKTELKAVEADFFEEKQKLVDQLESNENEIKKMINTQNTDVSSEENLARRIKRINFMRTLMVMLISTSGKNLQDPSILTNCIKFSEPLSLRDLLKK